MAQSNIILRERAVYVGEESTFGAAPAGSFPNAMTRVLVDQESLLFADVTREMLDVGDVRVRREDAIDPVLGLQLGSKVGALKLLLKATPSASQLTAGTSPASLTPRLFLRHALGAEHADEGSTVATGTSTTVFDVQSGDGATFAKGQFIAVQVSGQMEWTKVTNVSTDTITVSPALSGTPSTSAIVRQLYTYAPAESHTSSLAVRSAQVGDANAQFEAVGCHGSIGFELETGKLPSMTLDLAAVAHATGAFSFSTATASDEMGTSAAFTPSIYLATSLSRASTTSDVTKVAIAYENTWEQRRDPSATATVGGSTFPSTVAGVVNTGGRPRAVKLMATVRYDPAYQTAFEARTAYRLVIAWRIGTGTTASFWIFEMPNARITSNPKLSAVDSRGYVELEFSGLQDGSVTLASETGTALDLIVAPFRVAFG